MMDRETCSWPFDAKGVTKGLFQAIGLINFYLFLAYYFTHMFFMSAFSEKSPQKKTLFYNGYVLLNNDKS